MCVDTMPGKAKRGYKNSRRDTAESPPPAAGAPHLTFFGSEMNMWMILHAMNVPLWNSTAAKNIDATPPPPPPPDDGVDWNPLQVVPWQPEQFVTRDCKRRWDQDELCSDDCVGCKNRPLGPRRLEIKKTTTGDGVFAGIWTILKDQIICFFGDTGVVVLNSLQGDSRTQKLMTELFKMLKKPEYFDAFPYSVECTLVDGRRALFVPRQDAMKLSEDMQTALQAQGNLSGPDCGHLVNHSCCTCEETGWNCQLHAVQTARGELRMAVVAARDIRAGEQLRLRYAPKSELPFDCTCCKCRGACGN